MNLRFNSTCQPPRLAWLTAVLVVLLWSQLANAAHIHVHDEAPAAETACASCLSALDHALPGDVAPPVVGAGVVEQAASARIGPAPTARRLAFAARAPPGLQTI